MATQPGPVLSAQACPAPRLAAEYQRGSLASLGFAVSPSRRRARRSQRIARRGRRLVARAPARGLPPRHLSLVQRSPADPVVESRSAHGSVRGRVQAVTLLAPRRAAAALRSSGGYGVS